MRGTLEADAEDRAVRRRRALFVWLVLIPGAWVVVGLIVWGVNAIAVSAASH